MKHLQPKIMVSFFLISLTLECTAATNPCLPIAKACMDAGYYKGGHKVGKGLVVNCVMPIVAHNMSLPNLYVSDEVLNQCKKVLLKQMHD